MACSAIILSGGRGSRAGGRDKGLLQHRGTPLVEQVLQRLAPQVDDILISANRNLERYRALGHPVISDQLHDYQGPLAGILACLPHCQRPVALILPCDVPELPLDLAARLLPALDSHEVCYAWDGERDQYLCAALRCNLVDSLRGYLANGQRSVHRWYAGVRCQRVDFSDCPDAFTNINSPA